jgi:hypothetical protein
MKPLAKSDSEKLYATVYQLEGNRHPVESPEALDAAADFIAAQMRAYGLKVREQEFFIEGWSRPFRNIEGSIGAVDEKPAAVLTAHYDSANTPGANDDAAGIAVILEAARILSQMDNPPPVYIVAVSIEESSNPIHYSKIKDSARRHGVVDGQDRYVSWAIAKAAKKIQERSIAFYYSGKSQGDGYRQGLLDLGDAVPSNLRAHIEEIIPIFEPITATSAIGLRSRIGSHRWVQDAIQSAKKIAFNINIDEPGTFRYEPKTQGLLGGMGFESFSKGYKLDPEKEIGNFSLLVTHQPSQYLGEIYSQHCEDDGIELPYAWIHAPLTYEQIAAYQPMGLNSDHAPFWQAGIPALFIFDSSNARSNYIHTPADTIDKIDFDRLVDITNALAATLIDERVYQAGSAN